MTVKSINMGSEGFTAFADVQARKQEYARDQAIEHLEDRYKRELEVQKAAVRLGFAWHILQLDITSRSRKFFTSLGLGGEVADVQEFVTPLKRSNSNVGRIVLHTAVRNFSLAELTVGNTQAGFMGQMYRITATGPQPDEMILQTKEHNEPDESFVNVCSAAEIDADKNWVGAMHFAINANLVHDFLYKPAD